MSEENVGGPHNEQFGPAHLSPSPASPPEQPPAEQPLAEPSAAEPVQGPPPFLPPYPHQAASGHTTHAALASGVQEHARQRPPVGASPGYTPPPNFTPPPARTSRSSRRVRRGAAVALAAGALLLGATGGVIGTQALMGNSPEEGSASPSPTNAEGTAPALRPPAKGEAMATVAEVAAQVLPSTVYIEVLTPNSMSSGTGMVLRTDGYVVTNHHVVAAGLEQESLIQITFPDGDVQEASVVGSTRDYDIAVLQVDRTDLVPLPLADSSEVVVGDPVVAVGAPLGLDGTVTAGIVSALNRAVTAGSASEVSYINAIQTDAAINPGNSGGPLVNMSGEVIGINSAIAQPPGSQRATGSIGLGFAIPSDQVARTTEQLIELGYATYPVIGVLLDGSHTGEGVLVARSPGQGGVPAITPDGPGDQAGVEPGDVILRIDGRPVTSPDEVIVMIRSHAPGASVTLSIRRGSEEFDLEVVLGESRAN